MDTLHGVDEHVIFHFFVQCFGVNRERWTEVMPSWKQYLQTMLYPPQAVHRLGHGVLGFVVTHVWYEIWSEQRENWLNMTYIRGRGSLVGAQIDLFSSYIMTFLVNAISPASLFRGPNLVTPTLDNG